LSKAILYNVIGVLVVAAIIYFKIPAIWVVAGILLLVLFVIFNPFIPRVDSIPKGFTEKQVALRGITMNYVEGPDNGPPLLFVPGQMEFWQGYMLVLPAFVQDYHVFAVDLRGHGKSTRTPGEYSYKIIGEDLKEFLKQVVGEPAVVSGLSSGAVLVLWLAANAPKQVSAIISEDPPLFSAMWPQIRDEKFMFRLFEVMVDNLDKPKRDVLGFFMAQGIPNPKEGQNDLLLIPPLIAKFIVGLFNINKRFRPARKYDVPLAPFNGRVGFKFLCEYDVDFSKATIDGRLTEGFDPEKTLVKIQCPVLLIQASCSRDETWGILGALDDEGVEKIRSLVKDLKHVKVEAQHDVHLSKPKVFIPVVAEFLDELKERKVI
jgi:pimeloyl-ACP methyl ester carboxylesterase